MQFASNQARFTFAGMDFVTKLVEGKFPDYNRVIPTGYSNSVTLARLDFMKQEPRAVRGDDRHRAAVRNAAYNNPCRFTAR